MGSTRHRSWSFSRQRLFQTCKRAFFFQYYWKGEPDQDVLWELRRVKTIPLLVGDVVHDSISVALRQWADAHVQATNLIDGAGKQYEGLLCASLNAAKAMRRGCRPPGSGPILVHHLMTGKRSVIEEAGLDMLRDYLAVFESSEAWQFLRHKKTYTQLWQPITTSSDDKPYFETSGALGFLRVIGVRVYTPYDLALTHRGEFIIVDWKAGQRTAEAMAQVRKQLATYCLWALDRRKARRVALRIQPYFLQPEQPWAPSTVGKEEFFDVVREIEDHVLAEMQLVTVRGNKDGEPIGYVAHAEDFLPSPRQSICATCKFLTVCAEGKEVVGESCSLSVKG